MQINISQTMRAILLTEEGAEPKVLDIPVPRPGKGEVLVKMFASPINPSDLSFIKGGYGITKLFPMVPGFEGSGVVVKAGQGLLPRMWLGKRVSCAAYSKYNGCWAEYMVTKAGLCVPYSKSIQEAQAAMMFVNPMTALAFFDLYKKTPNPGKKSRGIINLPGAGALGRMIIRLGRKKGIPVISIVRRDEQIEILKKEGAEFIMNSTHPSFEERLNEIAHRLNASIIFDAVGGTLSKQLLNAVPSDSHHFIYGRLSDEPFDISLANLIFSGHHIHGFWLNNWLQKKNMFQNLINTRKIQSLMREQFRTDIYRQISLDEIVEAIDVYKRNMSKGKFLIRLSGDESK